jgi:signal transduction histidine kinase
MVAGYSLALVAERRTVVVAGLAVAPAVLANLAVVSDHGLMSVETVKNLAFVFLPLVLGVAVRNRRDYLAALVERAETAERTREEEARRRADEERLRIARDLHDLVAHSLVAINVQAGVAAHVQDPETSRQAFRDIKQVSGEALADLRTTLGVLRAGDAEAPVTPTPGLDQVADLAGVLRSSGVEVSLDLADDTADVPGPVGATAYRITQEALTNVMRHASPTRAHVSAVCDGPTLVLTVTNDEPAPGREPAPGSGHGLQGMRERAAALGGSLDAGPTADGGWLVRARLPLSAGPSAVGPDGGAPEAAEGTAHEPAKGVAQEPAVR